MRVNTDQRSATHVCETMAGFMPYVADVYTHSSQRLGFAACAPFSVQARTHETPQGTRPAGSQCQSIVRSLVGVVAVAVAPPWVTVAVRFDASEVLTFGRAHEILDGARAVDRQVARSHQF